MRRRRTRVMSRNAEETTQTAGLVGLPLPQISCKVCDGSGD